MIVYLTEQGAVVRKKGERIAVEKQGEMLQEILLIDLNALVIMGNVQLTTQAAAVLMNRGIDVFFLTLGGRFKGRLCGSINRNIFLRMAQYERFNTERVKYARSFVKGKILNSLYLVKKQEWGKSEDRTVLKQLADRSERLLSEADSVDRIYGIEGNFSKAYFSLWGKSLIDDSFAERVKRPAYDYINASLNLAYSMLNNDIICKLETVGFESALGFLHSPHYGRASLACDMIEEFRAPIADRFVRNGINGSLILSNQFELTNEGCRFKQENLRQFLERYQEYYNSYNRIVLKQIQKLKRAVLTGEDYEPWKAKDII